MSKNEKKKAKAQAKNPGEKKPHRVRKVLLIICAVLAILILVLFASCKVMCMPGDPVVETYDDATEISAAAANKGTPIEAHEARNIPEETLYQSINSTGWEQTGDVYDKVDDPSWYESEQTSEYVGTDANELMKACYSTCHKEGSLDAYSAPYDEAKASVQRMVDDYGCELSEEQVESLTSLFVEE